MKVVKMGRRNGCCRLGLRRHLSARKDTCREHSGQDDTDAHLHGHSYAGRPSVRPAVTPIQTGRKNCSANATTMRHQSVASHRWRLDLHVTDMATVFLDEAMMKQGVGRPHAVID